MKLKSYSFQEFVDRIIGYSKNWSYEKLGFRRIVLLKNRFRRICFGTIAFEELSATSIGYSLISSYALGSETGI